MEIKSLCALRDIYRAIKDFEARFQQEHNLSLNEGMLLCNLKNRNHISSEIAETLNLTASNASKVIKSAEDKGFIERAMGKDDKRQMYFSITKSGLEKLKRIQCECSENAAKEILNNIQTNKINSINH